MVIKLKTLELIMAQFADDTQLFLENKVALRNAIQALACIETNIGLHVNYDKTSILRLGTDNEICIEDKPLIWDPGGMEVLGIDIL